MTQQSDQLELVRQLLAAQASLGAEGVTPPVAFVMTQADVLLMLQLLGYVARGSRQAFRQQLRSFAAIQIPHFFKLLKPPLSP